MSRPVEIPTPAVAESKSEGEYARYPCRPDAICGYWPVSMYRATLLSTSRSISTIVLIAIGHSLDQKRFYSARPR
jgi:hypothetical protein